MSSLHEGSIIGERYRLERLVARGGMGSVWKAQHLKLNVDVAIKLMAPAFASDADARARFEREAKASAQLKSPHVVQVHDYGIAGDSPYIVMELLEGEDLEARLRRERRLSLAATLSIVEQACRALSRAHGAGIVHRDLKPANIFIARDGGGELVKVLDFGIAKATDPALVGQATKTGALLGSPHYMSPEQVRTSKDVDHRSDLWSLGVIVFRCLTGELPFPGDEIGEVLVEICADPIPVASQIAPDLGPAVDGFFERALMRDRNQRFQSAGALVEALASLARASGQATTGATTGATMGVVDSAKHSAATPGEVLARAASSSQAPPVSGVGTLAPSGHSLVEAPKSGLRPGILLAVAGSVLVVAIAAFTLLRSPESNSNAASPSSPVLPPPAEAPSPPPAPVAPSADARTGSPSAQASVSAPASGSSQVNPPSPLKGRSAPNSKTRPSHDPLDRP
jgi:serine/threonine-protein kinase